MPPSGQRFLLRLVNTSIVGKSLIAHCRWPLGTNLIEGINNKIKVIKRMAYGFRDDAYFFLKIRAAFPELGEEPFFRTAGDASFSIRTACAHDSGGALLGGSMEWFVAQIGDPVAVRAFRDLVSDEVRAARAAGELMPAAQIYARIDAAAVVFVFNELTAQLDPALAFE